MVPKSALGSVDGYVAQDYSDLAVAGGSGAVIASLYARMNLANSLTLLRIFFVPVLIVILLTRSPNVAV